MFLKHSTAALEIYSVRAVEGGHNNDNDNNKNGNNNDNNMTINRHYHNISNDNDMSKTYNGNEKNDSYDMMLVYEYIHSYELWNVVTCIKTTAFGSSL